MTIFAAERCRLDVFLPLFRHPDWCRPRTAWVLFVQAQCWSEHWPDYAPRLHAALEGREPSTPT